MSYYITDASGNRVPFQEGGQLKNVETIAEASTLDVEDSGKVFILDAAAGAAITLPSAVSGWCAKFIIGSAFATTGWTVVSGSTNIQGTVIVNGASVLGSDEDTITFAAAAENVGDWVEVVSDGTNFYVSGVGSAASSITLTAS